MDTSEFRNQLLDIRKILESFLEDNEKEQDQNFQDKLNELNKEYELIHDSLLTVINYFSLQQNAIRALLLIENVTREKTIKIQEVEYLRNAIRMMILPQVETLLYNLKSAVKSKERVLNYLENNPIKNVPDLVQEMVTMDKKFLDVIEQPQQAMTSNLLEQTLQAMLMSHLDNAQEYINKMTQNLGKPETSTEQVNTSEEEEN